MGCFIHKRIIVVYIRGEEMSEIAHIVGERLRVYRIRKKLSQEALGELAGLHGKYIGQLERGEKNATLESIGKVCRALDLPLETLFENIITGENGNGFAKNCYELIAAQPEKEQKDLLDLIKWVIAYKNI